MSSEIPDDKPITAGIIDFVDDSLRNKVIF